MINLFISDLDGTLLAPDGTVPFQSAETISRLSRKGVAITVATARTPATMEPLLALTYTSIPAIVMTGAALWDRQRMRYLHPRFFPHELALAAVNVCHESGLRSFLYILDETNMLHTYFHGTPSEAESRFIDERNHCKLKKIHISDIQIEPTGRTMLLFAIGERNVVESAAARLRALGCAVSAYPDIYTPHIYLLEVFAPGVSKAAALQKLKGITGAGTVTVFGDNLNDIPMMKAADIAVAVGNALPQVKSVADKTIGTNAENAVAKYISEQCGEHIQTL